MLIVVPCVCRLWRDVCRASLSTARLDLLWAPTTTGTDRDKDRAILPTLAARFAGFSDVQLSFFQAADDAGLAAVAPKCAAVDMTSSAWCS